ncbi:MAG: tetratricopeptide repeat protein, partial [Planctomycetaceae bacterium]
LADFETLLADLNPDSWLYRDVRERIEHVFLRTDDYAGLVQYYEAWLAKHEDDIHAMTRIGRALSMQGRLPEAQSWFERAIERAPSDKGLRRALIEQFIRAGKFAEAAEQYEELAEIDPNNPDVIQEWGALVLQDTSRPEAQRKQDAAAIWRRLLKDRPDDPVIVSQVADLLRQAKLTDEAIALYQRAIELAPNEPQYREYLGEFYHTLERKADAVATWKQIAAGENRTTRNLVRLGEVLAGFGYRKEAIEAFSAAVEMDPEFTDRMKFAVLLREDGQYDAALQQLDLAVKLAENDDERLAVLADRIRNFQAKDTLDAEIEALRKELEADANAAADRWHRLALYLEADRDLNQATAALQTALEKDETSVPVWTTAARLYEAAGRLGEAVEANRRLAAIDRRYRTEYLAKVATLEMRLGRQDEALAAGRDLIAAAPGNPEHYQFFAELNFQLGRTEEGLDALRRSVRVNPSDPAALLALAAALGEQFRTDEAIEIYWRAFEQAEDLERQLSVVGRLAELYLRLNR